MTCDRPLCNICSAGKQCIQFFTCSKVECLQTTSLLWLWEETRRGWGPALTLKADLAPSLLYVSKACSIQCLRGVSFLAAPSGRRNDSVTALYFPFSEICRLTHFPLPLRQLQNYARESHTRQWLISILLSIANQNKRSFYFVIVIIVI